MMFKTVKLCCQLFLVPTVILIVAFVNNGGGKPPLKLSADGSIIYYPDEQGNTIPDFSHVGYHQGDRPIPNVPVVKILSPTPNGNSEKLIQNAIDEVSELRLDKNGFRGAILLKKGIYNIPGSLSIKASGIVLRGEGNTDDGTKLVATGKGKRSLIIVNGDGMPDEQIETKVTIADNFVPSGAMSFNVTSGKVFKAGDQVILFRPATSNWITDLKMDQIPPRPDTIRVAQWKPEKFELKFERTITKVQGNKIFLDNPVVMQMEKKYGGGQMYKYGYKGRIAEIGIENIALESTYTSDTDEDHSWIGVEIDKAENCWVSNVVAKYFSFGCVHIKQFGKCVTVQNSRCSDAKSIIIGGRRYSFYIRGQLNLVINCESSESRHDYATSNMACGPNVFSNCIAADAHSDIGPHQRWAVGTLYDNVKTGGTMAVQDRSSLGTGQGWAGVTHVFWNCTAARTVVQSPWVSGKNYCIGLKGKKWEGAFPGRPDGEWYDYDAQTMPQYLYTAQLNARKSTK